MSEDVHIPDPLREHPPADRFCDLVFTGGVVSGVVYPWAILELAREFRFRQIGGTSIGALAAAVAAASEYGRCHHVRHAFEVVRQAPLNLAEDPRTDDGQPKPGAEAQTRMRSLFIPSERGKQLFELLVQALHTTSSPEVLRRKSPPWQWPGRRWLLARWRLWITRPIRHLRKWAVFFRHYLWAAMTHPIALSVAIVVLTMGWAIAQYGPSGWVGVVAGPSGLVLFLLWVLLALHHLWRDIAEGVLKNGLGFCTGLGGQGQEGITDWLHKSIQLAAGLDEDGDPLTFADLWRARHTPFDPPPDGDPFKYPSDRGIDLQLITSNLTFGRPYRFPRTHADEKLYFDPEDWDKYFPAPVMRYLRRVSRPYERASASDAPVSNVPGLLELPVAGLPIVVATRMSMSFPLLFSAIKLYASDHQADADRAKRVLRPCRFVDGGVCSNFPIHLFDATVPSWPTFGFWLTDRSPGFADDKHAVWLPRWHGAGRGALWQRFEQATAKRSRSAKQVRAEPSTLGELGKYLGALFTLATDWSDASRLRLPTVRNRVARLALRKEIGEGSLNLNMSAALIRRMAHDYGTVSGLEFVRRFAPTADGEPSAAWKEHLYVRTQTLLAGLREMLRGFRTAADTRAFSVPVGTLLCEATRKAPLNLLEPRHEQESEQSQTARRDSDPLRKPLPTENAKVMTEALALLYALEKKLDQAMTGAPYAPDPQPQLRLRPPT